MILLIDNYDSFVHNLARYVRELGWEAVVRRNDTLTLDDTVVCWGLEAPVISEAPADNETFTHVEASAEFACALTDENMVECWGADVCWASNSYGESTHP